MSRHAHHQHREEGRRHQRQPGIAGPEHSQQHGHQRPVDHRGEGRPADCLTHLVGVVDAGEDLTDLPRLEELQGQSLEVAGIPRDQGQVHLAADVRHQILPEHAEHGPEEDDQHHADAQRVEQPPLVVYEHGVHEVLDEVGGGYPQHGHEDRADEALGQDGGVGGQQAEEPPPGTDGGGARRRTGLPLHRDDQQQVIGPNPAELVAREGLDPARRVGHDDGALPDAVDDDEMPRSLVVAEVCDGRQRHTAQGLVRAPGTLGRKAERLGGLHHRQEACAATVRTDQVAKLEEADGSAVVQRDRRQRRGATVAPVLLVNNHVSMQHVRTPWKMGSVGSDEMDPPHPAVGSLRARPFAPAISGDHQVIRPARAPTAGWPPVELELLDEGAIAGRERGVVEHLAAVRVDDGIPRQQPPALRDIAIQVDSCAAAPGPSAPLPSSIQR